MKIDKERIELKKARFPAVISTAIACFLFWLLITGQLVMLLEGEPSWQVLVAGVLVSTGVALFSAKFFIHSTPFISGIPSGWPQVCSTASVSSPGS